MRRSGACLIALALGACSSGLEVVTDCRDERGLHPVCGLQSPEDLALLGDGRTVVVSQLGAVDGTRPGNLALLDTRSELLRIAFRGGAGDPPAPRPGWGDPDCPGPPGAEFSPHGIDLARRPDRRSQLLVVNHGGRESVELFEVTGAGPVAALEWRGCALPPDGAFFNDVVHLPDGGFLVTQMMDRDAQLWGRLRAALGLETGFVYEWGPGRGYRAVPGTEGSMPNGIEVSADGREIFLNLYGAGEVRRISRETGEVLAQVELPAPDKSSWGRDGRLLVASHVGPLGDILACLEVVEGACPLAFEIVALDPVTLEAERVFANAGAPMGAGSVALDLGGELLIGALAGDRILRAPPEA